MHPNLIVFPDRDEAEDWVWNAAPLLKRFSVLIVANPTPAHPDGCSVLFQP